MITMRVDGPLREHDIGLLGGEQVAVNLVVFVIDLGAAVDPQFGFERSGQDSRRRSSLHRD